MKLVYEHNDSILIYSAKNILESNEITCTIKNEHSGVTGGAELGITNIYFELWVNNDSDFDQAKSIINKKLTNNNSKKDWVCIQCNEANDSSFEICWKCQSVHIKD